MDPQGPPDLCPRCGLSTTKSEFQTIKFGDIFPHFASSISQREECRCLPQQEQGNPLNTNANSNEGYQSFHSPGEQRGDYQQQISESQSQQSFHHFYEGVIRGGTNTQQLQLHSLQQNGSQSQEPSIQDTLDAFITQELLLDPGQVHQGQGQQQQSAFVTVLPPHSSDRMKVEIPVVTNATNHNPPITTGVITENTNKSSASAATSIIKPPRVPCSLCKKTFVNDKMKETHVKRVHEKVNRFVCEICGAVFSYRGSLDSHLASHNPPEVTFDCPTCGQKFKEKSNLHQHMKYHSDNPKRFLCPECPSGFSKRVNLNYHMKRKHPDKVASASSTSATATGSGASSTTLGKLDDPSDKKSKGEGSFKCEQCGRGFLFKNNLKAHVRTHTREKKFACTECDKSFIYKESLKNHKLLHSNELPYHCDICGKKFRDRSNRRKHVKNVHKYLLANNNNNNNVDGPESSKGSVEKVSTAPTPTAAQKKDSNGVIKKARKKKKDAAPKVPAAVINPAITPKSVIVSVSMTNNQENERKIIMSPGPRIDMAGSTVSPGQTTNVIVKASPHPTVRPSVSGQMQNVIVYPNQSQKVVLRPEIINSPNGYMKPDQSYLPHINGGIGGQIVYHIPTTTTSGYSNIGQHHQQSEMILLHSDQQVQGGSIRYAFDGQTLLPQNGDLGGYWSSQGQGPQSSPYQEQGGFISLQPQQSSVIYSCSSGNASSGVISSVNIKQEQQGQDGNLTLPDSHGGHNGNQHSLYKDLSQFDFSYL